MIPKSLLAVAAVLVALALVGAVVGQPTAEETAARFSVQFDREILSRKYHIDPGELLELMHDPDVDLLVFDVRDERDYNLFHLKDSIRVRTPALDNAFSADWPEPAVKVVVSNGEAAAQEAWRRLRATGMLNVYILEGGINFWLDVYGGTYEVAGGSGNFVAADHDLASGGRLTHDPARVAQPFDLTLINDELRHVFTAAVGDAYPAARPDIKHLPKREFTKKVVIQLAGPKVSGGCG